MYKNRAKIKRKTRSKSLDLVLRFILALFLYIETAFYVVSENLFLGFCCSKKAVVLTLAQIEQRNVLWLFFRWFETSVITD